MNEKVVEFRQKTTEFWQSRTQKQKGLVLGSVVLIIAFIIALSWVGSRTNLVPLYSNMTVQETGEIKANLDNRGIQNEVSSDGTTILVPETNVDNLKVELAAEGIPQSGRIDYGTFGDNMGFGTTDSEFQLLERAALQSTLEDLIRNVDGITNAQVMITLPEESVWLQETPSEATASILLNMQAGYTLDESQIRALYHLASRSVPNLTTENIVIMDQFSRYLELDEQPGGTDSTLSVYEQHRSIQRDIERDLQRDLQQMLGTMMGPDKVLVSVSTDLDFTEENRTEDLIEPVDEENIEGIAISVERITETYSGEDVADGGVPGAGEDDIPNFPGVAGGAGAGDYERIEERINNDVNRIHREITESPYELRDISIQVMVEPPDPEDVGSLPQQTVDDIQAMLSQIVRTSISADVTADWGEEELAERVLVSPQEFFGRVQFDDPQTGIPFWYYVVGALALVVIVIIVGLLRRNKQEEVREVVSEEDQDFRLPPIDKKPQTEEGARKQQLEDLAKDKPDEFSKLIRTWLSDDN